MLKTVLKNGIFYSLSAFLLEGINILLIPIYTNFFTPEEFGIIDIFYVTGIIINFVVALEISQAIARFIPEMANNENKKIHFSSALFFVVGSYLLFVFLMWLFSDVLSSFIFDADGNAWTFVLAIFAISLNGIFIFLQNYLRTEIRPKENAIGSAVVAFLLAISVMLFLFVFKFGIEGIFYAQIISYSIGNVISLFYSRQHLGFILSKKVLLNLIKFSAPLVPSSISVFFALYIDRWLIKELLGLYEVGLYAIAYRIASVVGLLIVAFQGALTPLIYKLYSLPSTPKEIERMFRFFMAGVLLLFLLISLFSNYILYIFTSPDYYSAASIIPYLICIIIISRLYVFAPGLFIAKKTKSIALINILVAILNVLLNIFLIPRFQIMGAVYATLISAFVGFVINLLMSQKEFSIPFRWLRIIFSSFLAMLIIYILSSVDQNFFYDLISRIFITILFAVFISYFLIGREAINQFLRKVKIYLHH